MTTTQKESYLDGLQLTRWANGLDPLPAEKINVRLHSAASEGKPLVRQLTKVCWRRIKGTRWLYWYWKPEPRNDGSFDCGYSGITESNPNL